MRPTTTERVAHLADHARQVREHHGKLRAKCYWHQFEPSPDFVVMFVPDETLHPAAWEQDASWRDGSITVHVASPRRSSSSAVDRDGWQQETSPDAREVLTLGRELYEPESMAGI